MIESHLLKELSLIFLAKKLICIGEKFVPQIACLSSEGNKLIWVIAQHFIAKGSNVNRNLHKVVYKNKNLAPR